MHEEWNHSLSLLGTHMVSSIGRVKRISRRVNSSFGATRVISEKVISHRAADGGYIRFNLMVDGNEKTFLVHRLVAEVFVSNPDGLPHVNHKNGIKNDNRPENLEWCTHRENCIHAMESGLNKSRKSVCCKGHDGFGFWFWSMKEAAKFTGVSRPCISAAASGKQMMAGGLFWAKCPPLNMVDEGESNG